MRLNDIRRRLRRQDGFTMALVMGLLVFASLLGLAAYASAQGDRNLSAESRDRKQAYAAAEAGLNWYLAQLNLNPNYWTKCAYNGTPPAAAGSNGVPRFVNNAWAKPTTRPDRPALVDDADRARTAQYTLEVLPAPGNASCSQSTMIDNTRHVPHPRDRALQRRQALDRRAVRQARASSTSSGSRDYETTDPLAYAPANQAAANTYCSQFRPARDAQNTFNCQEIQFGNGDVLKGPLHSKDSLLVCPPVTFGNSGTDKVESRQDPAWERSGGCSGSPTVTSGSIRAGARQVDMPDTNDELESSADIVYSGDTSIAAQQQQDDRDDRQPGRDLHEHRPARQRPGLRQDGLVARRAAPRSRRSCRPTAAARAPSPRAARTSTSRARRPRTSRSPAPRTSSSPATSSTPATR